ncbi:HAD-IA family hydrolase [Streptomyces beijiangensis]|uniref:HAD-IA family hydrolase n=1 Tax=Streptomyces beijiangensis TaxID=163361 RepID=A0A939JI19_9ACTN|nr:HAD-IA family hydrolase [Streptomyces beijiangensis]MBO0515058.1 HAD-IA family hydrolase [Streptomyces beijiangensis]
MASGVRDRARRVLVVGIDGVRLDTLRTVDTPHLDSVEAAGFLAPVEIRPGTPTMSGPCWATIVTGVSVDKHAVWSNDFSGNRLTVFPDFTTRLTRGDGRRTYVAAGWQPLVTVADGGPLFREPSRLSHAAPAAETCEDWEAVDEQMTADAVRVLSDEDPEASFVYLGATDETAHILGCVPEYERSIARADERLGRLLAAVRGRATYDDEAWTFIVVTDHGHRDEGGHGGRTDQERTAWIACSGPDVPAGATVRELRHEDVAAQVFAALGRPADSHWTLDGRPFTVVPQAVLFDMDGTLVDTESLWWKTAEDVAGGLGHRLSDADIPEVVGRAVEDTAAHLFRISDAARPLAEITADLDERFLAAVEADTVLLPGARQLLDLLNGLGIPTALVSASPRPVVDAVLKVLGTESFRTTVAAGETPATKPAPDPYLAAARTLGVDPSGCLVVEDSPTGIAAGEAAGCLVAAVPSFVPVQAAPGRRVLTGLGELLRDFR